MPGRRFRSPTARYLPVAYCVTALAVAAALLPTALRPPPQAPPSAAELSPDSPPDEEILLTELKGGQTRTAGTGVAVEGEGLPGLPELKPSRGRCYGAPPRQLETVYGPPCVPAFTGKNPGATWRGVTENEIRIGFITGLVGNTGCDGEITDAPTNCENSQTRTYRVLRKYFNENLELYGRSLRFFHIYSQQDQNDPTVSRTSAARAATEYKVFAAISETSVEVQDELAKRGVINFANNEVNRAFFAARRPYAWSTNPDATTMIELGADYLCKKLNGKPPKWTDDPSFDYSKPRKFGVLSYQEGEGYQENVPLLRRLMREQCGADVAEAVEYGLSSDASGGSFAGPAATAIARMRAAGVTTIISLQDFVSTTFFTQQADEAGYFPEWYIPGFGGMDVVDFFFHAYSPNQWRHAFGYSLFEIPARPEDSECWRAYHSVDPENNPNADMCYYMWLLMVQLFSSLQLAGPTLTPDAVQKGLYAYGYHPPEPVWRMAGGYGPDDWTYPDWAAEIWYDPSAEHPKGGLGAYRYINGGQRFRRGEVTTAEPAFFKDRGITSAPRTPQ